MGRIDALGAGRVPLYEPGLEERVAAAVEKGLLRFLHRDEVAEDVGDAALIATGTPPTHGGAADLRQVSAAVQWVASTRPRDAVIVMKSTVPPGTGLRLLDQELKGSAVRYVSNPEFLREGRALQDWTSPDRIVIGVEPGDGRSVEIVTAMYDGIDAPHMVTDITSAEMIKYASNAFLATRISFINEIALLCGAVGASIDAVSQGLAMDSRTGGRIHAGVGYGGSCFPKDVRALDHLALTSDANVDLLRSVINTNNRQRLLPLHALRRRFQGSLSGLRVGILGLAFKPETDDVRDAPALDLVRALAGEGADIHAFDPQAMEAARSVLPASVEDGQRRRGGRQRGAGAGAHDRVGPDSWPPTGRRWPGACVRRGTCSTAGTPLTPPRWTGWASSTSAWEEDRLSREPMTSGQAGAHRLQASLEGVEDQPHLFQRHHAAEGVVTRLPEDDGGVPLPWGSPIKHSDMPRLILVPSARTNSISLLGPSSSDFHTRSGRCR